MRFRSLFYFVSVFFYVLFISYGLNAMVNLTLYRVDFSLSPRLYDREVKFFHYSGGLGNNLYGLVSACTIASILDAKLTCKDCIQ